MTDLRLYDNTRISDFRRCPRYFYYRHVRHWVRDGTSLPLVFGSGWHAAMEEVWPRLIRREPHGRVLDAAFERFLEEWKAAGLEYPLDYETEQEFSPRTPGNALEMLAAYIEKRGVLLESGDIELHAIEQPFAVPLDPNDPTLFYVGKIDKIVESRGHVRAIEHKTTTAYSKAAGFRSSFVDSFSPNSQVSGYLYALHMMFPGLPDGVWVDAALVHKTEHDSFKFIPIDQKVSYLDSWLWTTRAWIDQIEANKVRAAEATAKDKYMAAFPMNTNSCHDFNTSCQYIDLCKAWTNPVGKPTPMGFKDEVWDPTDRLNLERLEFPK